MPPSGWRSGRNSPASSAQLILYLLLRLGQGAFAVPAPGAQLDEVTLQAQAVEIRLPPHVVEHLALLDGAEKIVDIGDGLMVIVHERLTGGTTRSGRGAEGQGVGLLLEKARAMPPGAEHDMGHSGACISLERKRLGASDVCDPTWVSWPHRAR